MEIPTPIAIALAVVVGALVLLFSIYGGFFVIIPFWIQCRRCRIRLASVKVDDANRLSSQAYADAGVDVLYGGGHVCSVCWQELKDKGFPTGGNWAPGAIVEYLKNTPNFMALFISGGALAVAIIALLT